MISFIIQTFRTDAQKPIKDATNCPILNFVLFYDARLRLTHVMSLIQCALQSLALAKIFIYQLQCKKVKKAQKVLIKFAITSLVDPI